MKEYMCVGSVSETELIVNKSRFIGRAWPVETEEEALALIESTRKKHWDATHNCFAYRIGDTAGAARFSDDGEPGGTAGKPIMDVLTGRPLTNTLIIVTRYFGGVLLGTGGLVRAYSRSASDAVSAAGVVTMRFAFRVRIPLSYSQFSSLEGWLSSALQVESRDYSDFVTITGLIAASGLPAFCKELTRRSDGRLLAECIGEGWLRLPYFS